MTNILFIAGLGLFFTVLFAWGFRNLPLERWQVMACVPLTRDESGSWRGLNLTYYGFFNALAYGISVSLLFVLLGATGIPFTGIAVMTVIVLALCVPASSLIARIVEKKRFTFSIGGASFVGIIVTPWVILATNRFAGDMMHFSLPLYPTLAAVSIAYAAGEGTGRLACISYGCCYGKPLSKSGPLLRRLFEHRSFVFTGKTKKIAYASHLDGVKVIPVQAVTCIIYTIAALIGIAFYLNNAFFIAFIIPLVTTQLWRVLSEFLRADYRGNGRISAYQVMAVISVLYTGALLFFLPPAGGVTVDMGLGFLTFWNPAMIITLEIIIIFTFLYTGRSNMTASRLTLHVNEDRL